MSRHRRAGEALRFRLENDNVDRIKCDEAFISPALTSETQ